MQEFNYTVIEPNDDYRLAKIEKSGITATFTLAEVEAHEQKLLTWKKEREAENGVERAKMENIRHFHPVVDTLDGMQLTAVALFKESKMTIEKSEAKLKEIDEALKEYADEKALIMERLGFVPTSITPNQEGDVQATGDSKKE
jgi:pentose-5-phosphate-3-epimerase